MDSKSKTQTPTHEVFAGWVRERPDAVAVVCGDVAVSFAEVDARADRLAGVLRAQGVGPDVRVGVCLPRSVDFVVAVLGVLKAGGAFVPLDPQYPLARLEYMLRDSAALLVVGEGAPAEALGASVGVRVLAPGQQGATEAASGPALMADNLAYVIYTSGSTGKPKGVQVTHGALSNALEAAAVALKVGPDRRTLQCVSFSFDTSVADTLATVSRGGTLVVARKDDVASADALAGLLVNERINTLVLPPSVLSTLRHQSFPDLAVVVSGGESCPPKLAAAWSGGRRFLNAYGPTETTIASAYFRVTENMGDLAFVPIGTAMPGAAMYVADNGVTAVKPGETGEICIGGVGVARGYLGAPGRTAAAFVPDPFSDVPGSRMYRTGDLGRELPDGNIEFRGRIDSQVKVRGHRIELDEIERVLERHPAIQQAAVVVAEAGLLGTQILAFASVHGRGGGAAAGNSRITGSELRGYLSRKLPDYMLPNAITLVDDFPLTANQKIDRSALAAASAMVRQRVGEPTPAKTPAEEAILRIWCDVLGWEDVGTRDDFFDLGGHSLLASRIVTRVQNEFGVKFTLASFLKDGRTVENLAQAVAEAAARDAGALPRIKRIQRHQRRQQ